MDIPVNGEAHCKDGRSGTVKAVIINPINRKLTYVVIQYKGVEYLVPRKMVTATTPDLIVLDCLREKLRKQELFVKRQFLNVDTLELPIEGDYYLEPFVDIDQNDISYSSTLVFDQENVPYGELVMKRGSDVMAADGKIGSIDEFVVNRESGSITHIVLRDGHLWGKRDITVPLTEVAKIEGGTVTLKMNKKSVESLPKVRVERWWDQG